MRLPIIVAALATTAVLGTGGALTRIDAWYAGLRRPPWQPPNWLFGPAWTAIGVLTAWSAVLAWDRTRTRGERTILIGFFVANGVLNVLWSGLFFTLRRPDWALAEVVLLWLSIVALIAAVAPLSALGGWLLAPYLAWVTFASVLNRAVVRLNAPFKPA